MRHGIAPIRLEFWLFETNGTKKDVILKNKPGKLHKTNDRASKTNPNKPKNKPGNLLKMGSAGKNKAKNKAGHVIEKAEALKTGQGLGKLAYLCRTG